MDWEEQMNTDQEKFLRDEFFSLTLAATVQRAGVYRSGCSEKERRPFHDYLRLKLEEIAKQYENEVPDEKHIQNIVELSNGLSGTHKDVLRDKRFRIGTAQKALNLYLKYLWCIGKIPTPPHCPFDSFIVNKLPTYHGPKWTALDNEEEYRNLVAAARVKAQGCPLSAWELRTYNGDPPGVSGGAAPTMRA
jgi:hypothetical protein